MPRLELDESFFGEDWVFTPLELSDSREEVLRDFNRSTAQQEGESKYKEDTEAYDHAMSREPHSSEEDRAAIDHFKRMMR